MNLFKKIYTAISDAAKEIAQERRLKASYTTCLAKLEEDLIRNEDYFEKKIKSDYASFDDIKNAYMDIVAIKEEIQLTKDAYEYLFTEENKK